jgi:hypothetical protein
MTGSAVMVEGGLLAPVGGMAFQESGTGASDSALGRTPQAK